MWRLTQRRLRGHHRRKRGPGTTPAVVPGQPPARLPAATGNSRGALLPPGGPAEHHSPVQTRHWGNWVLGGALRHRYEVGAGPLFPVADLGCVWWQ